MKRWSTEMQVLNQHTKELHWVEGRTVIAFSRELAQKILDDNNFHYLVLGDEIVCEIPCNKKLEPDWNRMLDFEAIREN